MEYNRQVMKEYHGFNSDQEYEEYAQLMWLINNNK